MNASNHETERQSTETHATSAPHAAYVSWGWVKSPDTIASDVASATSSTQLPAQSLTQPIQSKPDLFQPIRQWLDCIAVNDIKFAHFLCKSIPAQCPFERNIKLFGLTVLHIPPLCKLNPVYDEVVALRFRALCYLADRCGEDVSSYC
jgi:Mo-dependent nitrogenase C-terminus